MLRWRSTSLAPPMAQRRVLAGLEVGDQRAPVVQVRLLSHEGCLARRPAATGPVRASGQRPVHSGRRFSLKALMPSAASSVPVTIVRPDCRIGSEWRTSRSSTS